MARTADALPASARPAGYARNTPATTTASERQGNMKGRKPDSRARMRDLARGRVTAAVEKERVAEDTRQGGSSGEEDSVLKRRSWALDGLLDCLCGNLANMVLRMVANGTDAPTADCSG
jgi:hypothetical protein